MSTLIYTVNKDWSEQTAQFQLDRRRVRLVILLVAVAIGPGVFLVDRLGSTVAWRSFLAEALSLCLYAAVAVWYSLRSPVRADGDERRAGIAWRVALGVYLAGLAIMGLVDLLTKRGPLSTALTDSHRAGDPVLWAGALMLGFIPLLGWVAWRYPAEMCRVGLDLFRSFSRSSLSKYILVGTGVGFVIGFHFWLTTKAAGMELDVKPWPYMAWQVFYELGPQSLSEELFMRGVVFNELHFSRGWNFWGAALAASSLELLSLLVKQGYGVDLLVFVGVIFYTIVSGIASAGLFRWSRSVVPGYASNVVFGVVSMFR